MKRITQLIMIGTLLSLLAGFMGSSLFAQAKNPFLAAAKQNAPQKPKIDKNSTKIPANVQGKTRAIGALALGDVVVFEFDRRNSFFQSENLTTGAYYYGNFDTYDDPDEQPTSNLYHLNVGGKNYFGVDLHNKFIANNFPDGSGKNNGIFSGINSRINNYNTFSNFDGAYLVFHMNLNSLYDPNQGMKWGVALMGETEYGSKEGAILLKLYDTQQWLPHEVYLEEEINLLMAAVEGKSTNSNRPYANDGTTSVGLYTVDPYHTSAFDMYFMDLETAKADPMEMGEYFAGTGFADADEGMMVVDLGPGNGFLQFVRITDLNMEINDLDPSGYHLYVQSDADFGSGGGFFDVYTKTINAQGDEGYFLDIEHFSEDASSDKDVEITEDLYLTEGNIPVIYYANLGDANTGERLYFVNASQFIMHFTIDMKSRKMLNFGVGAVSEVY